MDIGSGFDHRDIIADASENVKLLRDFLPGQSRSSDDGRIRRQPARALKPYAVDSRQSQVQRSR